MKQSVNIKIATPPDAPVVAAIGRFTFYETWRPVNTEEDMQLYLADAFNEEKILMDISADDANIFFIVTGDNEAIGYAKLRRDRTYNEFRGMKNIEMERIYVKQKFQGLKLGKLLMDRCIEFAVNESCDWLWLAVNNENFKAISFYKKYGFITFGTKKFRLGNAEDEDLLMKLDLRTIDLSS